MEAAEDAAGVAAALVGGVCHAGGVVPAALHRRLAALLPGCGLAALALPVGETYLQTHNLLRPPAPCALRVVPADAPYLAFMQAKGAPVVLRVPRCAGGGACPGGSAALGSALTPNPAHAHPCARRPADPHCVLVSLPVALSAEGGQAQGASFAASLVAPAPPALLACLLLAFREDVGVADRRCVLLPGGGDGAALAGARAHTRPHRPLPTQRRRVGGPAACRRAVPRRAAAGPERLCLHAGQGAGGARRAARGLNAGARARVQQRRGCARPPGWLAACVRGPPSWVWAPLPAGSVPLLLLLPPPLIRRLFFARRV